MASCRSRLRPSARPSVAAAFGPRVRWRGTPSTGHRTGACSLSRPPRAGRAAGKSATTSACLCPSRRHRLTSRTARSPGAVRATHGGGGAARSGVLLAAGVSRTSARRRALFPRTRPVSSLDPRARGTTGGRIDPAIPVVGRLDPPAATVGLFPLRCARPSGRVGVYRTRRPREPGLTACSLPKRFGTRLTAYHYTTRDRLRARWEGGGVLLRYTLPATYRSSWPSLPSDLSLRPAGYWRGPARSSSGALPRADRPGRLAQYVAEFNRIADASRTRAAADVPLQPLSGDPGTAQPLSGRSRASVLRDQVLPVSFARSRVRTTRSPGCSRRRCADPGLYAAGSDQAHVMGGHYPSAGSTSSRR